jgi:hypothetical protein
MSAQAPNVPSDPVQPSAPSTDPPNPSPVPGLQAGQFGANPALEARITHLGAEVAGLRDSVGSLATSQGTALSAGAMVGAAIIVAFLAILIVDRRVARIAKEIAS